MSNSRLKTNPFALEGNPKQQPQSNETKQIRKDVARENVKKKFLELFEPNEDSQIENIKNTSEKLSIDIEQNIFYINGETSQNKSYRDKIKKIEQRIKGNRNGYIREMLKKGIIEINAFCSLDDSTLSNDKYFKSLKGEDTTNTTETTKRNIHSHMKINRTTKPPQLNRFAKQNAFKNIPESNKEIDLTNNSNNINNNDKDIIQLGKGNLNENGTNEMTNEIQIGNNINSSENGNGNRIGENNPIDKISKQDNIYNENNQRDNEVNKENIVRKSQSKLEELRKILKMKKEKKEYSQSNTMPISELPKFKAKPPIENIQKNEELPQTTIQSEITTELSKDNGNFPQLTENILTQNNAFNEIGTKDKDIELIENNNENPQEDENKKLTEIIETKKEDIPTEEIIKEDKMNQNIINNQLNNIEDKKEENAPISLLEIPKDTNQINMFPDISNQIYEKEIEKEVDKQLPSQIQTHSPILSHQNENNILSNVFSSPNNIRPENKIIFSSHLANKQSIDFPSSSRLDISLMSTGGIKDKYKQLNESKIIMETELELAKRENASYKKEISSLKETMNQLREKISKANEENFKIELLRLKQSLKSKEKEAEKYKNENTQLKNQIMIYEKNVNLMISDNKKFREETEKRFNMYQKEIEVLRQALSEKKEREENFLKENEQIDIAFKEFNNNSNKKSIHDNEENEINSDFINGIHSQGISSSNDYLNMNGNIYDETKNNIHRERVDINNIINLNQNESGDNMQIGNNQKENEDKNINVSEKKICNNMNNNNEERSEKIQEVKNDNVNTEEIKEKNEKNSINEQGNINSNINTNTNTNTNNPFITSSPNKNLFEAQESLNNNNNTFDNISNPKEHTNLLSSKDKKSNNIFTNDQIVDHQSDSDLNQLFEQEPENVSNKQNEQNTISALSNTKNFKTFQNPFDMVLNDDKEEEENSQFNSNTQTKPITENTTKTTTLNRFKPKPIKNIKKPQTNLKPPITQKSPFQKRQQKNQNIFSHFEKDLDNDVFGSPFDNQKDSLFN